MVDWEYLQRTRGQLSPFDVYRPTSYMVGGLSRELCSTLNNTDACIVLNAFLDPHTEDQSPFNYSTLTSIPWDGYGRVPQEPSVEAASLVYAPFLNDLDSGQPNTLSHGITHRKPLMQHNELGFSPNTYRMPWPDTVPLEMDWVEPFGGSHQRANEPSLAPRNPIECERNILLQPYGTKLIFTLCRSRAGKPNIVVYIPATKPKHS